MRRKFIRIELRIKLRHKLSSKNGSSKNQGRPLLKSKVMGQIDEQNQRGLIITAHH